jgi:hypothetical protein
VRDLARRDFATLEGDGFVVRAGMRPGTLPRFPTTARKPSATRPRWNARAKRRAIASVFAPPKNNLASATRR